MSEKFQDNSILRCIDVFYGFWSQCARKLIVFLHAHIYWDDFFYAHHRSNCPYTHAQIDFLCIEGGIVEERIGKKKEYRSNTQSKTLEFYVKNPNQEKSRSRMWTTILSERFQEKKRTSQPLCIYNDILIYATLMTTCLFLYRKLGLQVMKLPNCLWHVP